VLLAGHLDTVPAQGNLPGSRDAERVHGLGASDMKGALAVMIELALAGTPYEVLFFAREELPQAESALTPLLARRRLGAELVVMMEPTDNTIHAGCLGNLNAQWSFHGRSGHSARPWLADNAIERAAAGIAALGAHGPEDHEFGGLVFREVASVTRIAGGSAANVIPRPRRLPPQLPLRPGAVSPRGGRGEARRADRRPRRAVGSPPTSPSGRGAGRQTAARPARRAGSHPVEPKQAWTPVAEFRAPSPHDANQPRPGSPAQAHRRDEAIEVAALVRCARLHDSIARQPLIRLSETSRAAERTRSFRLTEAKRDPRAAGSQ
jgi:succinyl-diaminopimelate desuccinylase